MRSLRFHASYLCKSVFICGCFLFLIGTAAASAFAQHGGKAEPLRIEFKRGTSSTTVSGNVRGDEQAEYAFSARKDQKVTIRITSVPSRSCLIELHGPENTDLVFSKYDYSATLPATGDYLLYVVRPTESKGRSNYKLTVTIR